MARHDRGRWDERYRTGDWADIDEPSAILSEATPWLEPPGPALDLACGAGRNALFLAARGFHVMAVDISWEGLSRLARRSRSASQRIQPVHADLERFEARSEAFGLIVNTHFLLRSTFPLIRRSLRPGGILLFETYNTDEIDLLGGDIRREYALERGELRKAFSDFEILLYEDGVVERAEGERGLARMIARKP